MIEPKEVERIRRHLRAFASKADDADALAIVDGLREEFGELIGAQARNLNRQGYSWSEIARPLGILRTTAHERYGDSERLVRKRAGAR